MSSLRAGMVVTLVTALALPATPAFANGRAPATSTLHFRRGNDNDVIAGMTFGLLITHDGGAHWRWMCEDAIGYGGVYDPFYAYTAGGALLATTFNGLRVTRDGCRFEPTPAGSTFASTNTLGPDGTFFWGASNPSGGGHVGDTHIYRSTDDGRTFDDGVLPLGSVPNDWWQSITVAPSDPSRVYLFGYRFDAQNEKQFLLYRSVDGGDSYEPMPSTDFTTSTESAIEVVGVDHANPDVVYAHVTEQDGMHLHGVYRSDDRGDHWTQIFSVSDLAFAFVLRGNGDLLIGTEEAGVSVSHDRGAHWSVIPTAPHINCLAESAAGEVWACTQNYSVMNGPPTDNAGIMKSADAITWTPVVKYEDIAEPVVCGSATTQHDDCQVQTWCGLKTQLGITSTALVCGSAAAEPEPAGLESPIQPHGRATAAGCCDTGADANGSFVLAGLAIALAWWRRPRRGKHLT